MFWHTYWDRESMEMMISNQSGDLKITMENIKIQIKLVVGK